MAESGYIFIEPEKFRLKFLAHLSDQEHKILPSHF